MQTDQSECALPKRQSNLKEKRKQAIFEAAVLCFNECGYFGTNIETIAERAHISKGGLYHYFSSKKELFKELFLYSVNKYFFHMKAYLRPEDSPAEQLGVVVTSASQMLKENEDFYRFCLEFLSKGARDHEIREIVTGFYNNSIATVRHIVEEGIRRGDFKDSVDAGQVARSFYLAVMGAYFTYFSVDVDFKIQEQHAFDIDTIISKIRR